ncbi:winged helix-turn-helix domain-containing protein [Aurantiacibacter odishensis]|uniref:winged helix-turn-helix domain-containing protein n=1 Tax=Aurantiacibacter odishensis TaxID=1155476 RepID=UPI000E72D678|nr:helix-turn-helix domain-containing protein [Aurantiacibacter odishensis]
MDVTPLFEGEIARLRAAGVSGESGRVRELFDYLAARGPDAESATQDELARKVFGQESSDADDATVRVYIHRLRKKLEDFYAANGAGENGAHIVLPSGTYALRLEGLEAGTQPPPKRRHGALRPRAFAYSTAALLLAITAAAALYFWAQRPGPPNAMWDPLAASDRPVLLVLGDYYMYGEIDPVEPDRGRLIRDFRIDSEQDLAALQDAEPDRYGFAEDVGLTYLPFSTAYALQEIMPAIGADDREVRIVAASDLRADMLRENDIVYLGLLSGMGLLERPVFGGSMLRIGGSYDELSDTATNRTFVSEEFRRLSAPVTYRDYGFLARITDENGGVLIVIAGARETALRSVARIAGGQNLPADLAERARGDRDMEALFQVTGQQGADLSEQLIFARGRTR